MADDLDLRPWAPDDLPEWERVAWWSHGEVVCDGVDLVVLGPNPSFACETCATPSCSDRRALRVRAWGDAVLLLPVGERTPEVLLAHGAVLVPGPTWRALAVRFPNLAEPLAPATRRDVVEAWTASWPVRRSDPDRLGRLLEGLLPGEEADPWELEQALRDALAWADAAPEEVAEGLPVVDPERAWVDPGARAWDGFGWDAEDTLRPRLGDLLIG